MLVISSVSIASSRADLASLTSVGCLDKTTGCRYTFSNKGLSIYVCLVNKEVFVDLDDIVNASHVLYIYYLDI